MANKTKAQLQDELDALVAMNEWQASALAIAQERLEAETKAKEALKGEVVNQAVVHSPTDEFLRDIRKLLQTTVEDLYESLVDAGGWKARFVEAMGYLNIQREEIEVHRAEKQRLAEKVQEQNNTIWRLQIAVDGVELPEYLTNYEIPQAR